MKNEFGVRLDRNGYAPSIMGAGGVCYVCGKRCVTQRHEFIHGANRDKSKRYGLWADVCGPCHTKIHNCDADLDWSLKRAAQKKAMDTYGWGIDDFRLIFGRNYLTED